MMMTTRIDSVFCYWQNSPLSTIASHLSHYYTYWYRWFSVRKFNCNCTTGWRIRSERKGWVAGSEIERKIESNKMQKQILMAFLSYLISTLYTATSATAAVHLPTICMFILRFDPFRFEDGVEFIEAEFRTKELKKLLVFFWQSIYLLKLYSIYIVLSPYNILLHSSSCAVSVERGSWGCNFSSYTFLHTLSNRFHFSITYSILDWKIFYAKPSISTLQTWNFWSESKVHTFTNRLKLYAISIIFNIK